MEDIWAKFYGDGPGWIAKAEKFFQVHEIPSFHELQWAFMSMEGAGMLWFYSWCQEYPDSNWESFSTASVRRSGISYDSRILDNLTTLKRDQIELESPIEILDHSVEKLKNKQGTIKEDEGSSSQDCGKMKKIGDCSNDNTEMTEVVIVFQKSLWPCRGAEVKIDKDKGEQGWDDHSKVKISESLSVSVSLAPSTAPPPKPPDASSHATVTESISAKPSCGSGKSESSEPPDVELLAASPPQPRKLPDFDNTETAIPEPPEPPVLMEAPWTLAMEDPSPLVFKPFATALPERELPDVGPPATATESSLTKPPGMGVFVREEASLRKRVDRRAKWGISELSDQFFNLLGLAQQGEGRLLDSIDPTISWA